MVLKENFGEMGHRLFRWRSYLPLLLLGIIILSMNQYNYPGHNHKLNQSWEIFCLIVSFLGLAIRIYTMGHAPRGTSEGRTKGQKAEYLNTTGSYSLVRHPLYLGNFFIWLGISMFVHLWWVSLIFILVFCVYYERIMCAEEEFLKSKFGDEYTTWTSTTPAFWPRFKNWEKPALPFSFRNVLKREYSPFFSIILSFTFLETVSNTFIEGKPHLDLMWLIIFLIGLIIYLTLRTLKKKTKLLSVDGR